MSPEGSEVKEVMATVLLEFHMRALFSCPSFVKFTLASLILIVRQQHFNICLFPEQLFHLFRGDSLESTTWVSVVGRGLHESLNAKSQIPKSCNDGTKCLIKLSTQILIYETYILTNRIRLQIFLIISFCIYTILQNTSLMYMSTCQRN